MLVFSIFFGRIFCGYICAGAGLGEMAGCINNKPAKLGNKKYNYFERKQLLDKMQELENGEKK